MKMMKNASFCLLSVTALLMALAPFRKLTPVSAPTLAPTLAADQAAERVVEGSRQFPPVEAKPAAPPDSSR